jgi:hypothetical protein
MFFIEKVGGARVLRQVLVVDLQSNNRRIIVGMTMIGHCHDAGFHIFARLGNSLLQVRRKSGDSAAAWQRVANECQAAGGAQVDAARSALFRAVFMMYFLLVTRSEMRRSEIFLTQSPFMATTLST